MHFSKYHGTGNDFILIDNRAGNISLSKEEIAQMCHRRFGIGADGLMLLETFAGADFRMIYYNADGGESTMCGNGGRCIVAFAKSLGIIGTEASFIAIDGHHSASINDAGIVSLEMIDVDEISDLGTYVMLNTGSPHYVLWVEDAEHSPVLEEGRRIRNEAQFSPGGINVNFVQRLSENRLRVRTYERGVEDETLSCGTGVTAAAIAAAGHTTGSFIYNIETPGGNLQVAFRKWAKNAAEDITLTGPATFVYEGILRDQRYKANS